MAATARAGYPIPSLSDVANGPDGFSDLAVDLEEHTVMKFTTSAVRDATITSPVAPMHAFLTTPRQLTAHDGTGWYILNEPAQTWTPAFTGVTVGNGTQAGIYHRTDGWIDFTAIFTLGSTSAITGDVGITLPIAGSADNLGAIFNARMLDTSVPTEYMLLVSAITTTTIKVRAIRADLTYVSGVAMSASIPIGTPATGDQIIIGGRYPMTSRYS